ncbi:MAG: phage tail protein [Lachnospiraceae bacterium]|nr:phage tail protein [Lachnospiraceae bacterium]
MGIGNAINALAGNLMTAFRNAICSVQSWFYNLLSTALTVIAGICEALNKLPFVEFDYSGISDAADHYAAKAAEAEENKEEYRDVAEAFREGFSTFDAFQDGWASDAFEAGAAWGDGIADKFSNFSFEDFFGAGDIPPVEEYGDQYGLRGPAEDSGLTDNVANIADNTDNINDSLECTQEDLKYLRDIAEQDAVNRFTIAEIKVEQTNHNNINSSMDLDGVVSGLTNAVNESIDSVTEGVHE